MPFILAPPFSSTWALADEPEPESQTASQFLRLNRFEKWRLEDFWEGLSKGGQQFWQEAKQGGFTAITGVKPRKPIALMEGATFIRDDTGVTFILTDGTRIPPLSKQGFQALKNRLPAYQRHNFDVKFFWLLQRNPALPLIASGLKQGQYRQLLNRGVFDTDTYYADYFISTLLGFAQQANVDPEELLALLETHFSTLENPYFVQLDQQKVPSGTIKSFHKYELELTNKQYLLRALLNTPLEAWARLKAIQQVEAAEVKSSYVGSQLASTTIHLGRLPLPTPTAAEDTPGVHALNINHLTQQGIHLFPPSLEEEASEYAAVYQEHLTERSRLSRLLTDLAETHGVDILAQINDFHDEEFWHQIGITETLDLHSVIQMDTSQLLGIYAARLELIAPLTAAESYDLAQHHLKSFFQKNSPGLSETELLTVLLKDQAFNPRLWNYLRWNMPPLVERINAIQKDIQALESRYVELTVQESKVFRELQNHNLDISTEAFSLLSVAMAKRLSDLMYEEFNPGDRKNPDYLRFTRGLYPFLRDMPDLNIQRGSNLAINRFGFDNYVVPDLMAMGCENAPVLSAIGRLRYDMVSNDDLNKWDFHGLIKFMAVGYSLSSNWHPLSLSQEQQEWLPLVSKYRTELKHLTGADGIMAPNVSHGLAGQDFRISTWPASRPTAKPQNASLSSNTSLHEFLPDLSEQKISDLTQAVLCCTGEITLTSSLVLLYQPSFRYGTDNTIDMVLLVDGVQRVIPAINHRFEAIYSPGYMARLKLPKEPTGDYVKALNQVILRTHALYGGYTPASMALPKALTVLD